MKEYHFNDVLIIQNKKELEIHQDNHIFWVICKSYKTVNQIIDLYAYPQFNNVD
jgi:hypothetical protein